MFREHIKESLVAIVLAPKYGIAGSADGYKYVRCWASKVPEGLAQYKGLGLVGYNLRIDRRFVSGVRGKSLEKLEEIVRSETEGTCPNPTLFVCAGYYGETDEWRMVHGSNKTAPYVAVSETPLNLCRHHADLYLLTEDGFAVNVNDPHFLGGNKSVNSDRHELTEEERNNIVSVLDNAGLMM